MHSRAYLLLQRDMERLQTEPVWVSAISKSFLFGCDASGRVFGGVLSCVCFRASLRLLCPTSMCLSGEQDYVDPREQTGKVGC